MAYVTNLRQIILKMRFLTKNQNFQNNKNGIKSLKTNQQYSSNPTT